MTNREKVLTFLRSILFEDASNSEIARRLDIQPHQQVFQITQKLLSDGLIEGKQSEREWRFRISTVRTEEVSAASEDVREVSVQLA